MITFCIDHVREFYDQKNAACTPAQPPNTHLFLGSDNAANQAKNNYHFSWMIDYVEEDHSLQTIQQNFTAEQHGKGTCFVNHTTGLLLYAFNTIHLWCFRSHLCLIRSMGCRRRGRKTGSESAAVHSYEINTAFDLYTLIKDLHSQVTNSFHEALH